MTIPSGIADGVYWFLAIIGLLALLWACACWIVWSEGEEKRQNAMRRKYLGNWPSRPYDWGTDGL